LLLTARAQESLCRLDGRVVDLAGNVLAGARVILTNSSGQVVDRQPTDVDGKFTFAGIEPGTFGMNVTAPGFHSEHRTVVLRAGDVVHLDIGLFVGRVEDPPTIRVDGMVRTPDGKPVSGAVVTVRPTWNSRLAIRTSTNRSGHYSVVLALGGQYEFHARAKDETSGVVVALFGLPLKAQTIDITLDRSSIDIP
jgi:Carboxypeptidase regulatory-like domain